jgi:hypothetical protein
MVNSKRRKVKIKNLPKSSKNLDIFFNFLKNPPNVTNFFEKIVQKNSLHHVAWDLNK